MWQANCSYMGCRSNLLARRKKGVARRKIPKNDHRSKVNREKSNIKKEIK
jgi:hypothetical protein